MTNTLNNELSKKLLQMYTDSISEATSLFKSYESCTQVQSYERDMIDESNIYDFKDLLMQLESLAI